MLTKTAKQTQKIGEDFAHVIARSGATKQSQASATVFALRGNLGAGKTTFLQGFAKGLGIKEKVLSPTFVIMKRFQILLVVKSTLSRDFSDRCFYHFDCYRLNKPEEILELSFEKIIKNPQNIVAIEWPEKIKKYLPKETIFINFKFIDEKTRELTIKR